MEPSASPSRTPDALVAVAKPPTGIVKSLAKGLRALTLLLENQDVGTLDLAKALGVDKGAASRILKTLVHAGFAVQDVGRRFRASPAIRARPPGEAANDGVSIRERARPLLRRIYEATGETAHLAILADDQVLYLDKVECEQPLRVERPVGTLAPLHCTALGKTLLAFGNLSVPRNLAGFTHRTAVSEAVLAADLAKIVEAGFAIDDEEFAPGIRCVAAPLRGASGTVVGAIGLSGPATRIGRGQLDTLGHLVAAIARQFPVAG